MSSATVYNGVENSERGAGGLFQGQKLYISHSVPQRQQFIEKVKNNGGMVVDLEKQANILIWDHMKKNVPPGSYSYKYIESSVRAGKLEDLDHHRIGAPAGTIRPVGSIVTAPKGRRIPFTDADDQLLYNWVKPLANQGLETKGNKVYQDIEATHGRHPWQSWRDRWIKSVSSQKRNITADHVSSPEHDDISVETTRKLRPVNAPRGDGIQVVVTARPTTQVDTPHQPKTQSSQSRPKPEDHVSQSSQESPNELFNALFQAASIILELPPDEEMNAWDRFQREHTSLSAKDWRKYFYEYVKPKYEEAQRLQEEEVAEQEGCCGNRSDDGQMISAFRNPKSTSTSPALRRYRSPSWQPSTPTLLDRVVLFSANQARKRSPIRRSKTDSQESQNSDFGKDSNAAADLPQPGATKRKRDSYSPQLLISEKAIIVQTPKKSRFTSPEIASTPDRQAQLAGSERTYSPMFYPEEHEAAQASNTGAIASSPGVAGTTDPLDIHLISEANDTNDGSSNNARSERTKILSIASKDLENERNHSAEDSDTDADAFETAPSEGDREEQEEDLIHAESEGVYETARTRRVETQNLFNTQPSLAFNDLPPPPGGWSALASPTGEPSFPPPAHSSQSLSGSDVDSDSSSPPTDLSTFLSSHLPSSLSPTEVDEHEAHLLRALFTVTTSSANDLKPSDYALADTVYTHLQRTGSIPGNLKGVWTEEDDERLFGGDAREIDRVRRKHGDEALRGRWVILGEEEG